MSEAFDRAVAFQREFERRRAETAIRSTHGTAYLSPTLPKVYDRNVFLVDLGAKASAEELVAEAAWAFLMHDLAHRKIAIDDELATAVDAEFRDAGWQVEKLVVMPHARPATPVETSAVEEVAADVLVPVWESRMRRDIADAETIAQLIEAQRGRADALDVRYFATRFGGRIASYCELFSDGRTGQIESVMTEEEFRNRGLGTAVVAGALAASRAVHDFTFIVADANDWPKELYRKLGFEPAGTVHRFLLRPEN